MKRKINPSVDYHISTIHSGAISKDEMVSMFLMMCQDNQDEDQESLDRKLEAKEIARKAEELFNELDIDNDEVVTLDEFIKGCLANEDIIKHLST